MGTDKQLTDPWSPPEWKFWAGLSLILLANLVWELLNDVPPVWDMAYHQLLGWRYLQAWNEGTLLEKFAELSPQYPPLYYLMEALVLAFQPGTQFLAFLSNLPAAIVLSYSSYRLAGYFLPQNCWVYAGLTPMLLAEVAWVSRESLLDFTLAAWVAAAVWMVLKSRLLDSLGWTLALGLASVAGGLTKWVFPIYVVAVIALAVWHSPNRRRSCRNLALTTVLLLPLVLLYYGPNLGALLARYPTTDQAGLIPWKPYPRHGEPGLNNPLGWIYYPRVLAGYFLQLPLLVLWGAGIWRQRNLRDKGRYAWVLWAWFIGAIVLLTLLTPKDPRFAVPLATPLALLLFYFWRDRPFVLHLAFSLAVLHFLLVSFYPGAPVKIAFFELKEDRDYQTIQQEWVWFQTHYFDVTGPPRVELWPYHSILEVLPEDASVGFLPELSRFHAEGLQLKAAELDRSLRVYRLGDSDRWISLLENLDFVVSKTGNQGISFLTGFNEEISAELQAQAWLAAAVLPLPDGTRATVWKRPGREPSGVPR